MIIVKNLVKLEIILRKDNALKYFIEHWLVGVSISFANTIRKKPLWVTVIAKP